jgi:hypothetical protein
MWTSDEFSGSRHAGPGEVGPREDTFARLSASRAEDRPIPSPIDGELRRRAAEARARTQALINDYVVCCTRMNAELTRRRELVVARDKIRSELSASIARYAVLLRALGEPPERALVLVKTAFSEAAPHQDDDSRAVLEDIVKWVVDAYYAA